MEPIISPWFIYALSVVDSFRGVLSVASHLMGIGVLLTLIAKGFFAMPPSIDENTDKKIQKITNRILKAAIPSFLICLMLFIFTPASKTLMAMYAASVATPDNISAVVGAGKSFKDEVKQDIIDLMERGLDKPDNKGLAE